MAAIGVEQAIWEFLRINSSVVTGNFLTDIVNLIILPTVMLIIFIDFVACRLLGVKPEGNMAKVKPILEIAIYMVFIVQGWYGPFAMFASNFLLLFIILSFILFIVNSFILPKEAVRFGERLGEAHNETGGFIEKNREIRLLEDEIRNLKRNIDDDIMRLKNTSGSYQDHQRAEIERNINQTKAQINDKQNKINRLKRIF